MTPAENPNTPSEPSLTARVVKGGTWVFAGKIAGRGLTMVKILVLARLLAPEDFGLFGIAMLAMATIGTFTKTGFDAALVQRRDDARAHLDTAWTVQIIRGLVLAFLLFAAAPLVGWFFEEPRAISLLRVLCLSKVVGAFKNIGIIYWRKEIEFHKQVIYSFATSFVTTAIGITLAFALRNVWALVWASLGGSITEIVLSYAMHPYRPRINWNTEQARELFGFGRWVLGSSVLIFFITHGDDAFLAKVLGVTALGIYQLAYRISNLAATEITHTLSSVLFPAYSKLQEDQPRFRNVYLRALATTLLFSAPMAAGTAAAAPLVVPVLLGPQWAASIVPIQILAAYGFCRSWAATVGPVFYASGQPKEQTRVAVIQLVVLAILIWPLTAAFRVPGTCLAVTMSMMTALLYSQKQVANILSCNAIQLLRSVGAPVVASAATGAVVSLLAYTLPASAIALTIVVLVGIVAYAIFLPIFGAIIRPPVRLQLRSLISVFKPSVGRARAC